MIFLQDNFGDLSMLAMQRQTGAWAPVEERGDLRNAVHLIRPARLTG